MSISAEHHLKLDIFETPALGLDLVTDKAVAHELPAAEEVAGRLDAKTTPAVTKAFSDKGQLPSGPATIDLTALAGLLGSTVDFTGLKVQAWFFKALSTNTDAITIKPAASNGYHLFGDAADQITLEPGEAEQRFCNGTRPDVAAGAKDLTLSSLDVNAEYYVKMVAGLIT